MLAGIVLTALVLVAGTSDRTGRYGAFALAALSILWLFSGHGMEGWVLVSFTRTHGFTASNMVSVAGLCLAVWRFAQAPQAPQAPQAER